jgi:hypothetical protein
MEVTDMIASAYHHNANIGLHRHNHPALVFPPALPTAAQQATQDARAIVDAALWRCQSSGSGVETPEVDILLGARDHLYRTR